MPKWSCGRPNWGPLKRCLRRFRLDDFIGAFMFMGSVGDIQLYKHKLTRRYLNLDCRGRAFGYFGEEGYRRIKTKSAIKDLVRTDVF